MTRPPTLGEWGEWAASVRPADLPEDVSRLARLQRANALAACAAGVLHPDAPAVVRAARALGRGTSIAPPGVRSLTVPGAVLAGAALATAHDYDDQVLAAHPAASAAVVPLVVGAEAGADSETALVAQVVANELMGRLGAACLVGPQAGPVTTALHRLGSAAATARVLGLGPGDTANALALALHHPPTARWHGFLSSARLVAAAEPAADGIRAAWLAKAGLGAPLDALDAADGFLGTFAYAPLRGFLGGLGRAWLTRTLSFHFAPGGPYLRAAREALEDALARAGSAGAPVGPRDVRSVSVGLPLPGVELERLLAGGAAPSDLRLDPVASTGLVARGLAVRLARGAFGPEDLTLDALAGVAVPVADLVGRIQVRHEWRATFALLAGLSEGAGLDRALAAVSLRDWRHASRGIRETWGEGAFASIRDLPRAAGDLPAALRERALVTLVQRATAVPAALVEAGQSALRSATGWVERASTFLRTGVAAPVPALEVPVDGPVAEHDLAGADLAAGRLAVSARVELFLADGRLVEGRCEVPEGGWGRPPDEVARGVGTKVEREIGRLAGEADAARIARILLSPRARERTPAEVLEELATSAGSWPRGRPPRWLAGLVGSSDP